MPRKHFFARGGDGPSSKATTRSAVRTVAWRLCVSDWRSTQRLQRALARLKLVDATTSDIAAGSPLANALGLLDALPIDQRRVAVLYYIEDLPVDDIAALLDVPPGTVKSRLSRGREALRRSLAADQG
ncbi:RNA polymerase sigma factor [Nocardioides sp.]|uniref:RNA polymerase sigma factor n=1 Tax=Nocardioides sp. TaxID=35761 RepID=UPI003454132B